MAFSQYLYALLIYPIRLVLEVIFSMAFRVADAGPSLICESVAVSLLTLPLYAAAEKGQRQQRLIEQQLSLGIKRIKDTFHGDERFMMIQAFYKENYYHPLMALKSSFSLLIQIPFFMAAYTFLSELPLLNKEGFYFIANLGRGDALLHIGSVSINLLPILMTLINCVSGAIYTKGFPLRDKIQLYAMAAVFLVLLYNSPSGLVLYWTCNNIFSLIKNIVYRMKRPKLFVSILSFVAVLLVDYFLIFLIHNPAYQLAALLLVLSVIPAFVFYVWPHLPAGKKITAALTMQVKYKKTVLLLSCLFLAILTGFLIPSGVIASSPGEFINVNLFRRPTYLIYHAFCMSCGTFLIWVPLVYYFVPAKYKGFVSCCTLCLAVCFLVTYLFFGTNLGIMSSLLKFDVEPVFTWKEIILNFVLLLALSILFYNVYKYKSKIVVSLLSFLLVASCALTAKNMVHVIGSMNMIQKGIAAGIYGKTSSMSGSDITPVFHLSKKGKNVIVFMVDRAFGGFLPYIVKEHPELSEQYAGFVFYPNTVSLGGGTNVGSPVLFGGYEYGPWESNQRDRVLLKDKQNEALSLMPVLFGRAGYNVVVADIPYANYKVPSDFSIFDEYPFVTSYILQGKCTVQWENKNGVASGGLKLDERNFFLYGIFKSAPLLLQNLIYRWGTYWNPTPSVLTSEFLNDYTTLDSLKELTQIDEDGDNFISMQNEITHKPMLLQLPDYRPSDNVDNEPYEDKMSYKGGNEHYYVNAAAILRIGEWLDFMKEQGVYDNTRIIISSDHGAAGIEGIPAFDQSGHSDLCGYNPLLLVKDFNSNEPLRSDDQFMCHADVPTMALKDVVENPVNPFTGNPVNDDRKKSAPLYVMQGGTYEMDDLPPDLTTHESGGGYWWTVHDDIFNKDNWQKIKPGEKGKRLRDFN